MPIPNLSLSAGGGGPSHANSSAGVGTPINTPFNFDGSGWVVNFGNGNTTEARGNSGANQAAQSPSGNGGGGLLAGLGFDPKYLLLAGAVYLLMRR